MAKIKDLIIEQGKTFTAVVNWEGDPIVYKPITAITQSAPVRITSTGHAIPEGWRVAVVSVKGMTQINASTPPKDTDYHAATVADANTIELNAVNSADYKAYVSGGYLQFNTPVNMTGYSARMYIKDKVGGTELWRLDTTVPVPPALGGGIAIDVANFTITLTVSATDTEAFTWKKGVYELEMVSSGGVVKALLKGNITVEREITV